MTPPNPTPPSTERKEFKGKDIERVAPLFAFVAKGVFYTIFIADIVSILIPQDIFAVPAAYGRLDATLYASLALATLGGYLRRRCYRLLAAHFTFELAIRRDHKLFTSGPYAIVRHPSYTGALMAAGGCLMNALHSDSFVVRWLGLGGTNARWGVCSLIVGVIAYAALVPRMQKEDNMLHEAFGKEWEEWRRRVPYRLVPYVY
ncbi:hypothetical protein CYLTODRAFT_424229 [Cylindrobasidium torrendii FP15055 ss-10]|uniref:Protein-S-isoprenylcysteine O-methyltransferase n=1 Tax=Cylindrobasidium torrendii FP15055 ss-10 TaxID=1314674 RepID=A0A0D7B4W9_9AGAR|nr:hypothetical protein CYLTODRAFT_424229 [Cylindrobasidium torrendii FP15055 ss-10]